MYLYLALLFTVAALLCALYPVALVFAQPDYTASW